MQNIYHLTNIFCACYINIGSCPSLLMQEISSEPKCFFFQALVALGCMEHRGACSADSESGDGAGVMSQIPWDILKKDFPNIDESRTGYVTVD